MSARASVAAGAVNRAADAAVLPVWAYGVLAGIFATLLTVVVLGLAVLDGRQPPAEDPADTGLALLDLA